MTAPNIADRVRAVIEGNVVARLHADTVVVIRDADGYTYDAPVSSCTVLPGVLKVGDVVEAASQLDELPIGSVVCRAGVGYMPTIKSKSGKWAGILANLSPAAIAGWGDATVLRVGASL